LFKLKVMNYMENEILEVDKIKSLYAIRDELIDELIDDPFNIQLVITKIKLNKNEIKILTNKVLTDYNTKHTLEYRLKQAVYSENYELAAKLRDKIKNNNIEAN